MSYYPKGDQIAIGTIDGKIFVFDLLGKEKNKYIQSFTCRNRHGKNSWGKKVTSIFFINKNYAIITTGDSRIRLISMINGKNLIKYKGYSNENSMIRASVDFSTDTIISGSEDGFCYIWNIYGKEGKDKKNESYEYFKPFSKDVVECSIIVDEICLINYIKKVLHLTNKINVLSIIINSTDNGKIEVLLNIDEDNK